MTNIDIKVVGSANLTQMTGPFGKFEAQVAAANMQLEKLVVLQDGVDGKGFNRAAAAAATNEKAFASAARSTGLFNVEQLKVNSATDDYIKKLNKQKLSFSELLKQRKLSAAAYKDQLAAEQMIVKQSAQVSNSGKQMYQSLTPKNIGSGFDTLGKRVAFANAEIRSGAKQMLNWGKNTQWAGRQLSVGFTVPLAAFGVAAGAAAYKVDQGLTEIQKVYDTTANQNSQNVAEVNRANQELADVSKASFATATKAATEYGAAGTDTIDVISQLAATGQKGAALQKNAAEVMRISTLGDLDYNDAVKTTIALQSVFKMNSDDLAKSFNYINAVENATSLSTQDFAAAIPIAAAPVKAFGGNIQELGVLLTAMKSQGIEATQGANAIKAAMSRLGRPSKQVQGEWKELTNTDITQIFNKSTSLLDLFSKIKDATEDLSNKDRIKAFSGLFGTYQVTRMTALVNGMKDLHDQTTQTGKAYALASQNSSQWADVAANEIARKQESMSFKWNKAIESMKLELSTLGKPFVEVATDVVNGVSKIMKMFDKLPDSAKKVLGIGVGLVALTGPVLMFTGLMANMVSNGVLGLTRLVGMFVKMNIMDKNSRIAAKAADLASTSFFKEADALKEMTLQIEAMVAAQKEANKLTFATLAPRTQTPGNPTGFIGPQLPSAPTVLTANTQSPGNAYGFIGPQLPPAPTVASTQTAGNATGFIGPQLPVVPRATGEIGPQNLDREQLAAANKTTDAYKAQLATQEEQARIQAKITQSSEQGALSQQRMGKFLTVNSASAALFSAALVTSMATTNHVASNIAKWAMIGAVVLPAARALSTALAKSLVLTNLYESSMMKATAATSAAAEATGTLDASLLAANAEASSLAAEEAVASLVNPITAVVAGVAAVGAGIFLWKKHLDDVKKEQKEADENQAKLVDITDQFGNSIDQATAKYKQLNAVQGKGITLQKSTADNNQFTDNLKTYKDNQDALDSYSDLTPSQKSFSDQQRFIDLMGKLGMSAHQAQINMKAFYYATGDSMDSATAKSQLLANQVGKFKDIDWGKQLAAGLDNLNSSLGAMYDGNTARVDALGKQIGTVFVQGLASAKTVKGARDAVKELGDAVYSRWDDVAKKISANTSANISSGIRDAAKEGGKSLEQYMSGMSSDDIDKALTYELGSSDKGAGKVVSKDLADSAKQAQEFENHLTSSVSSTANLGDNIKTIDALIHTASVEASEMTFKQAIAEASKMVSVIGAQRKILDAMNKSGTANTTWAGNLLTAEESRNEQTAMIKINAYNAANGYKQGATYLQAQAYLTNKISADSKTTASDTGKILKNIKDIPKDASVKVAITYSKSDISGLYKGAMSDVQSDISDKISSNFDEQRSNAEDARQKMWDARTASQQKDFDREQKQLDSKWENKTDAANKYWDARIKKVNDEIKAEQSAEDKRKKMFDAEMARIDQLNQAMSNNIDFNTAINSGNFDEAAKVRNDASADSAKTVLQAAEDAGSDRVDRRANRMSDKADKLGEDKDKYMKDLSKREDAEKAHLQKLQDMRTAALKNEEDADMKALGVEWDARKAALDDQLSLFTSYIAKNKQDLDKHIKDVGLAYDVFGNGLMDKGETWSESFKNSLQKHIRAAGLELKSDKMWEQLGSGSMNGMLKGMGFNGGMPQFRHFINTGEMSGYKKPGGKANAGGGHHRASGIGTITGGKTGQQVYNQAHETHHEGGLVGSAGSRKGVARTVKGLHASERMVRAQTGEFVVNRKDTANNQGLLEHINTGGKFARGTANHNEGGGGSTSIGLPGLVAAFATRAALVGVEKSMDTLYSNKKTELAKERASSGGTYSVSKAYKQFGMSSEMLRNAATIASVGSSMHLSDRDIEIGIMTALTESGLINLHGGDRDSQGLFQQRPSQGWGSVAQITDPEYSARKFFESLKAVSNRGGMSAWMAAQTVQRSGTSDGSNYQRYWSEAQSVFKNGLKQNKDGDMLQQAPISMKGTTETGRHAIQWAMNQIGVMGWYERCLSFVRQALGANGGVYDAKASWYGVRNKYSAADPKTVPAGVPVFWLNGDHGHVALSTGNGGAISTDHPTTNTAGITTIPSISSWLGQAPAGWGADINGKSVYPTSAAAHLKVGGTIKKDGTPAVLHKDERVLTAPLTKNLDEGISSFQRVMHHAKKDAKRNEANRHHQGDPNFGKFRYPKVTTGLADSPYTYFSTTDISPHGNGAKHPKNAGRSKVQKASDKANKAFQHGDTEASAPVINDSGKSFKLSNATLNAYVNTPAAQTDGDVDRLTKSADVIFLQEINKKWKSISDHLAKIGWGMFAGTGSQPGMREVGIAWNKAKINLISAKSQKLGDITDKAILGGKYKRYANYALMKDKKSGREFYEVGVHPVPTPNFSKPHRKMFAEQWGNIDKLVNKLEGSGAPVFLGGDINERKDRPWWRTPEGLRAAKGGGVDYLFSNSKDAKLTGGHLIRGFHTDHAGAQTASYDIPALKKGAQNIRWDNTIANLHKGEAVLTKDLNDKFREGVNNFATGGNNTYNAIVNVPAGTNINEERLCNMLITKMKRMDSRKPGSRKL